MNPCLHFASLEQCKTILFLNSIPPSLLTTLSISQIATSLHSHLCDRATSLFSHLATSLHPDTFCILSPYSTHLPFPLSQLTTLPTFPVHLPPNDRRNTCD